MKILLKHLRDACDKEGNVEKRIQHECVKCLKAFMNNKVFSLILRFSMLRLSECRHFNLEYSEDFFSKRRK